MTALIPWRRMALRRLLQLDRPIAAATDAVERLARKKPVVVNVGFFLERLPVWLLIPAALLATPSAGRAPMLGAALAGVSYSLLFAISAGVSLAALMLMRWWVKEPRTA